MNELAQRCKVPPAEMPGRIDALEERLAEERKRSRAQAVSDSLGAADALADPAEQLDCVRLPVARVEADSADALRSMGDRLREQLQSAFVVIDGRPVLRARDQ